MKLKALWLLLLLSVSFSMASPTIKGKGSVPEPKLVILVNDKMIEFTRKELLARKDLIQLKVENDPAYHRPMKFSAVPVKALFTGIHVDKNAILQFQCVDGFSDTISQERVLNDAKDQSIAYLAIETRSSKWPPIDPPTVMKTAGPFYLVWSHPELSQIRREEWPYQVTGFEVKKPLSELYPKIFPAASLPDGHPVRKGFKTFVASCFACHSLNKEGGTKIGPDLNLPMSPVEYFYPRAFRALIRDPQAVRFWPLSKMHGFSRGQLSDLEVDDLETYLKYMAEHREEAK